MEERDVRSAAGRPLEIGVGEVGSASLTCLGYDTEERMKTQK